MNQSSNIDKVIANANEVIYGLYHKYKDDAYMFQKTHNYICFQLPNILDNLKKNYESNQMRIRELEGEQETFIQKFLNNNQYFYVSTTEKFFFYDSLDYQVYNEDDILHHVLTTISKEKQLMTWKKSTKVYIMKRIKENNLLKSVPESETIQTVLDSLCPLLFKTRSEAKYFLTIIGDNLLRKSNGLVYFLSPKSKHFLRELTNLSYMLFGVNCGGNIKYKYYEHEYANCRLLNINDCVSSDATWTPIIMKNGLNLLCVASHYSLRFNSADNFILHSCNDNDLRSYTMYLKEHSKDVLVGKFISEYIQTLELSKYPNATISWKNMQFLWKHYLDKKQIPSVMFVNSLKNILIQQLNDEYNEDDDSFYGVTSMYLPIIQKFMGFWDENVIVDTASNNMEYEIEELCMLFKKWQDNRNIRNSVFLNDTQMIDMIQYYYPGIDVDNNKYIYNIRCVLWDKQQDIQTALDALKEDIKTQFPRTETKQTILPIVTSYGTFGDELLIEQRSHYPPSNNNSNISIYDAYVWYCKYFSRNSEHHPLVSKSYFEKFVFDVAGFYIHDNKYIDVDWVYE
jgi:hypothetical protein